MDVTAPLICLINLPGQANSLCVCNNTDAKGNMENTKQRKGNNVSKTVRH